MLPSALLAALLLPVLLPPPPGSTARPQEIPAWKRDVVYQVFPRTFRDSSGDGIGDLRGVTEKVPYLDALGVNVVWLNPIYPNGGVDGGYDVTDLTGIDAVFGTMEDFQALVQAVHGRGMKILMDMVLNHTSIRHPWFKAEVARKTLQRQLATLVAHTSATDGEAVVNLLVDPGSAREQKGPHIERAQAAIDAFDATDDHAAQAAGYPDHQASKRAMAEHLLACAGRGAKCPQVQMPFDDFYVWRTKPNNWLSWFGGSAWLPIAEVGGVCMHIFSAEQIDLNWRNPRVREAMGAAAQTWRSRGVDGFRLDSIGTLAKDPRFLPGVPGKDSLGTSFFTNLPQIHRYIKEFTQRLGPDAVSIGELAANTPTAPIDFAAFELHELNEIFVFDHVVLDGDHAKWHKIPLDVAKFKAILLAQQNLIHGRAWLGNYLENHDQLRAVSRFGDTKVHHRASAAALGTLLMTLEGTPFIYQGQELGMTDLPDDAIAAVDEIEDVEARGWYHDRVAAGDDPKATLHAVATRCRDHMRTGMQWSAAPHAGFTDGETRVRIHPNYTWLNAEAEQKDQGSTWNAYRQLIRLRRQRMDWVVGAITDLAPEHPKVFAYTRAHAGQRSLVLLNLSSEPQSVALPESVHSALWSQKLYTNQAEFPAVAARVQLQPWQATIFAHEEARR